jgi:hypothetical protein
MAKLRLLIADDQPLMRAGFRAVLEATGEIEVVAEAGTADLSSGVFRDLVATVRDLLTNSALGQLAPVGPNAGVAMSAVVAIAVLVGWAVIPTVAGAWRTITQDA